jgi:hypothetical protein
MLFPWRGSVAGLPAARVWAVPAATMTPPAAREEVGLDEFDRGEYTPKL